MDLLSIIFKLLSAKLDGRRADVPESLSYEDWQQILGICAAQKIHTFVYDALPETGIPEDIREIWFRQVGANEKAGRLVDAVVTVQAETWRKRGLNFALLKGPAVAALYPVPGHRHCGDIDWWLGDQRSWDAAFEIARRNAENGVHTDSDGDINYVFKGVVIEHHRDWTHLSSRHLRKLAGMPEVTDGRLSPEDTLLSLMCHILHHVAWNGANLKQMLDLAIAFKSYEGTYDKTHFATRLQALGLSKWSSMLSDMLAGLTSVPESSLPAKPYISTSDRRRFFSVLFESKPRIASRVILMWHASPRECISRYAHLICGRLTNVGH